MYPRVMINIEKFRHNVKKLKELSSLNNCTMMGVTKVFCAAKPLVEVLNEEGVEYIADSRIENLRKIETNKPLVLLRLPMISEAYLVVRHSDISLNSEIETIRALNEAAVSIGKTHKVILMVDLGDLREGIFHETELINVTKEVLTMSNIELIGIGVNLTCYGGVIPSVEILENLVKYKELIENRFSINLDIISGGNSSDIPLMLNNSIPLGINNIRLGESLVLGRETAYGETIEGLYDDVFTLEAELIELKKKPTVPPVGKIGMDAFGHKPEFVDLGTVERGIIAVGKQDVYHKGLKPLDKVTLLGSSSDHILVDFHEVPGKYKLGDILKFKLNYSSILSLMTSPYVKKVYQYGQIDEEI